ncbi:MAG TPA: ATP-binding protein [Dongiaceae bacterium]|jgi:signal transduction histidine kinase|nr:ATP-binding protein [Dongiaceae bacterium]
MSELGFILNAATWPVLLLDAEARIRHGNVAAEDVFGAGLTAGNVALADFWSPENPQPANFFLGDWKTVALKPTLVRFRTRAGTPAAFQVALCRFTHEGRELFVLQLLPPPMAEVKNLPPAAPAAPPVIEVHKSGSDTALVHKQKLECALQLARTMALDFNNALTSILGHTSLVLGQMEPDHKWRQSLMEVEKSAAKAAEIASDLATFSRQDREPRSQNSGNLNLLLQRVTELFQNSAPDRKIWQLQLARKLYTAKFDEAKLQQVFVKIMENAVQALGPHGRITVQSRNLDLTAPTQDRNVQLAAGSYICAEITDTGCGIESDILPRIFEPFFTTKKAPEHRGLGLAWVYGVVTNHGGGVAVSSQPGVGTSVRVYLPAENKFIQENGLDPAELRGNETILMVDDEDLMLTMGQAVLSSFGYTVLTANSGHRALEILADADPVITLLITDLVMPGMSGRELVEQARLLSPETRILCTSGYVFPSSERNGTSYLQKPFTSRELALKVRQVLSLGR